MAAVAPSVTRCSSCGAAITWAETELGKRIPLDWPPQKRVVLEPRCPGGPEKARVVDSFVAHFATCKDAAKHRRPR